MKSKPPIALSAKNADKHELYETAVQQPTVMIGFIEEMYEQIGYPEPRIMREDFCGTGQLVSMWANAHPDRAGFGVDIDPEIIQYAKDRNKDLYGKDGQRVNFITADVIDHHDTADVLMSLNFSHFIYKRRADLLQYLKHAHSCINPNGMMILDAFGGPGAISECEDERNFSSFTYIWEQENYRPLTNEIICRIHFKFRDGTKLRNAFTYDWRMWSIPELAETLQGAGFGDMGIYFESEDGFIGDDEDIEADAWVAYIAAFRD